MKKLKAMFLMLAMVLSVCAPVYAADGAEEILVSTAVEYLENGDYIETVITAEPGIATYADGDKTYQSGSKTSTYKNANGESLWSVTVKASFTCITGKLAYCTDVSASTKVYSSSWKVGTPTTAYNGYTATATATGTLYWAFVPTDKVTITAELNCDSYGNLF